MKKEVAHQLLELCDELDGVTNKMAEIARSIEEEDQRKAVVRGVGEAVAATVTHVQVPIFKLFPELDPLPRRQT